MRLEPAAALAAGHGRKREGADGLVRLRARVRGARVRIVRLTGEIESRATPGGFAVRLRRRGVRRRDADQGTRRDSAGRGHRGDLAQTLPLADLFPFVRLDFGQLRATGIESLLRLLRSSLGLAQQCLVALGLGCHAAHAGPAALLQCRAFAGFFGQGRWNEHRGRGHQHAGEYVQHHTPPPRSTRIACVASDTTPFDNSVLYAAPAASRAARPLPGARCGVDELQQLAGEGLPDRGGAAPTVDAGERGLGSGEVADRADELLKVIYPRASVMPRDLQFIEQV